MNSRRKRAFRRNIVVAHCRRRRRRRRRPRSTPYVKSPSMPRRRLLLFRRRMTLRARSAHASPPPRPHLEGLASHACMHEIGHSAPQTGRAIGPHLSSVVCQYRIRSMDHARVCFRSDIRHHIRTTCPYRWTRIWRVMTRNESLMPRSHHARRASRSCDPHTRTRYAHDALYDERIHAIRRFRQGFHQGQGHDDDAVRVVCIRVYVYACVGDAARAYGYATARARDDDDDVVARCRIHGNDRDRDRGAVRARVRGRARGARDASRAMAYRRGCFVSFARAPCGREVSRLVVVVRSARLMRDPRLARAW